MLQTYPLCPSEQLSQAMVPTNLGATLSWALKVNLPNQQGVTLKSMANWMRESLQSMVFFTRREPQTPRLYCRNSIIYRQRVLPGWSHHLSKCRHQHSIYSHQISPAHPLQPEQPIFYVHLLSQHYPIVPLKNQGWSQSQGYLRLVLRMQVGVVNNVLENSQSERSISKLKSDPVLQDTLLIPNQETFGILKIS